MAKSSKAKKASKKARKVSKPKKAVKRAVKKSVKPKKATKIKKAPKAAKPVRAASRKKHLTSQEIMIFKAKLLEIRKKLTGDVSRLEEDALMNTRDASGDLSSYSLHMADVATDNYDQELNLGLASSEQDLLNRVENALKRIDEGTFGFSTKSGEAISKKRLNVVPYAELTIQEQEQEEKNRTRGV